MAAWVTLADVPPETVQTTHFHRFKASSTKALDQSFVQSCLVTRPKKSVITHLCVLEGLATCSDPFGCKALPQQRSNRSILSSVYVAVVGSFEQVATARVSNESIGWQRVAKKNCKVESMFFFVKEPPLPPFRSLEDFGRRKLCLRRVQAMTRSFHSLQLPLATQSQLWTNRRMQPLSIRS